MIESSFVESLWGVIDGAILSLLSPFKNDAWGLVQLSVRGVVTYAALHGARLTWLHGGGGCWRFMASAGMLVLGATYLMLLVVQLPWYQLVSLATPVTLLRDSALLVVLIYHLRRHKWLVKGRC